jgi:hypothetical protein
VSPLEAGNALDWTPVLYTIHVLDLKIVRRQTE